MMTRMMTTTTTMTTTTHRLFVSHEIHEIGSLIGDQQAVPISLPYVEHDIPLGRPNSSHLWHNVNPQDARLPRRGQDQMRQYHRRLHRPIQGFVRACG